MRLLASNLRDITNSIKERRRDEVLSKILESCLDDATMGRDFGYFDVYSDKVDSEQVKYIIQSLENMNYIVKCDSYVEDGYYSLTIKW